MISADFDNNGRNKTSILQQFLKLCTILLYNSHKIVGIAGDV